MFMISRFRRELDENCALLGYYTASSGKFLPVFRDNLSVSSSRGQESKIYFTCTAFYSCAPKFRVRFSDSFPNSCYMATSFRLSCGYLFSRFWDTIIVCNLCLSPLRIVGARDRL